MIEKTSSLWSPNEEIKKTSELGKFCKKLDKKKIFKYSQNFNDIWKWSVDSPEVFWSEVWDYTNIKDEKGKKIIKKNKIFYKNIFFPDSKLNYAENLLIKNNKEIAIKFLSESKIEKKITWNKLYENVCRLSFYLKTINLNEKDRVAAYVPNCIETIGKTVALNFFDGMFYT